jgi:multidrug efflux pump subunit AcrA (membrane-fusion protein)
VPYRSNDTSAIDPPHDAHRSAGEYNYTSKYAGGGEHRLNDYKGLGVIVKKIIIAIVALAVVGGGLYYALGRGTAPVAAPVVAAAPIKASAQVVAEAHVVPARSVELSLATGGIVAEVLAQEGDQVKAGQVIARLDDAQQTVRAAAPYVQAIVSYTDLC